ncbi:YphA family membrane protein [Brevibacillus fluminis]|uniref:YphA family membrane protein n=1 Tax=Brevibacillus fluminis TaxID=511487 RepID=UPI003F8AD829
MNEGIAAMVVQWCLICLVWMGSYNRLLARFRLTQATTLAVLAACLLSSFSNWRMYVLPIEVSVSGTIVPVMISAWMWTCLVRPGQASYLAAAVITMTSVLFCIKRLFIWDPVLMFADETVILPLLLTVLVFLFARHAEEQVFLLFFSVTLFDISHSLSLWGKVTPFAIGSPFCQDVLWLSVLTWSLAWSVVAAIIHSRLVGSIKSKLQSHR